MSQGTVMIQAQSRQLEKDFTVATPEEFVQRFKGNRVINKVNSSTISIVFNFFSSNKNLFFILAQTSLFS